MKRPLTKVFFALLLLYSLFRFGYSVARYNPVVYQPAGWDFYDTYERVGRWRTTGDYSVTGWETGYAYYPAFYYVLFYPISALPFPAVSSLFYFLQFPLFLAAILLMAKTVTHPRAPSAAELLIAVLLCVNFLPFLETFSEYKVEGIEFFLICLLVALWRKKRDGWAGALVVLAANLKYLPGILIGYFLIKRERRALWGMAAAGGAVLLALLLTLGPRVVRTYAVEYPFQILFNPSVCSNEMAVLPEWQTLSGTVNRWFAPPVMPEEFVRRLLRGIGPVGNPRLAFGVGYTLKLLLLGVYVAAVRRGPSLPDREKGWPATLMEISLTLLMIPILFMAGRLQYGILWLPAFVWTGLLLLRHGSLFPRTVKALFLAAYALGGMVVPSGLLNRLPPHPVWGQHHYLMALWLGVPFFGYLALFFCDLWMLRRLRRMPAAAEG